MDHTYSPQGTWTDRVSDRFRGGVRSGEMVWLAGQIDAGPHADIRHPGDRAAQVAGAVTNLGAALEGLGCDLTDLVKLLCFYIDDGTGDASVLAELASALPSDAHPAVSTVPVPYLAAPAALVLVEGYAMRAEDGTRLARTYAYAADLSPLPDRFASALRCGRMLFVSAQHPHADPVMGELGIVAQTGEVMARIGAALTALGAGYDDVVKINRWYLGHGKVEDFEPAALACASHFSEPGPAATGIPVPRLPPGHAVRIEVVAMLDLDGSRLPRRHVWPESLWDWTVHLPYKHGLKCHDMIFLGGQVSLDKHGQALHPDDLPEQIAQAMVHIGTILGELGAGYDDICKLTTAYQGATDLEGLRTGLDARGSWLEAAQPATSDLALPVLAYPAMIVEIDAFAMADPDPSDAPPQ